MKGGENMSKSWIVYPVIVCAILAIVCGYLYREWQNEKIMREFMETAHNICIEKCDYWQQQNNYYWQLYQDCLNQESYPWSGYTDK